jgi:hypothetical protein
MNKLYSRDYLMEKAARFFLTQTLLLHYMVEEFAS